MKEISDKEFDGFFKSSFEDFEVEPSSKSWGNISQRLDQKPAKKKFPIYWAAAASAVIVLGIGITLYQRPTVTIKLRPDENESVTSTIKVETLNKKDGAAVETDLPIEQTSSVKANNVPSNALQPLWRLRDRAALVSKSDQPEKNISAEAIKVPENSVLNSEPVNHQTQDLAETKPVKVRSVTEKILADEALKNGESMEVLPSKVLASQLKKEEDFEGSGTNSHRKLKIKSVADLVNFVIAKVDKRDEKIIRMSKTEESDNEITGINLGLFKFSKSDK